MGQFGQASIADVRRLAARVGEIGRQVGVWSDLPNWGGEMPMAGVVLSEGSATYGRAYRLNSMCQGSSGHFRLPTWMGGECLGMTKREAFEELVGRQSVLFMLAAERGIDIDHDEVERVSDLAESAKRVDWSLWSDVAPWANR